MSTSLKLEGKAWSNFLEVELAPQTKKLYSRWVQIFMQYSEIDDPDKLLQLGTVQDIEDRIIKWLGTLKDSGKATATMRTALASIVFYSSNRVKIAVSLWDVEFQESRLYRIAARQKMK